MKEEQISKQIKQIKQLIVDKRFKKAFLILAEIIEEIDRLDQEDADDGELENRMLMIRSRFNNFHKESISGTQTDKSEINRITLSILQFLDEVKDIAVEYSATDQPISTPNPPETVATGVLSNVPSTTPQEERNGCLIAFANKDSKVKINIPNFNLTKAILSTGAILLPLVIILFYVFPRGITPDSPGIGPISTPTPKEDPIIPAALGRNGEQMNFDDGTAEASMADYLSKPRSKSSKSFKADRISFEHNSDRLNPQAKNQLDKIADVLEEYPDATIDLSGFVLDNENSAYRGSKELALDDVRARSARDHLKKRGISESRLSFMGQGYANQSNLKIQVRK